MSRNRSATVGLARLQPPGFPNVVVNFLPGAIALESLDPMVW
jgi:hypothetical protein